MIFRTNKVISIQDEDDTYDISFTIRYDTFWYGADADGNHAEQRTELLDHEIDEARKNGHLISNRDIPIDILSQALSEVES